jgi:hypothetical protein
VGRVWEFFFSTDSRLALGPTQSPIQLAPGALSLGVKRPCRESDHSSPYVKECVEMYFHSSNTPSWRGAQMKHRDNFTFTLPPCPSAVIAQSVQRCATGWTIGVLEFDSRRGLGIFLFTNASRMALGPTQPPIRWVSGGTAAGK